MHSRDLIEQYKGYVQNWRRYFHKHPELVMKSLKRQRHSLKN